MANVADNKTDVLSLDSVPHFQSKRRKLRCLIAYWILGLCNNYGYVVMLTAAEDIINANSDNDAEEVKQYFF